MKTHYDQIKLIASNRFSQGKLNITGFNCISPKMSIKMKWSPFRS